MRICICESSKGKVATWAAAAADLQGHELVGRPVLLQNALQDGALGLVELPLIPTLDSISADTQAAVRRWAVQCCVPGVMCYSFCMIVSRKRQP